MFHPLLQSLITVLHCLVHKFLGFPGILEYFVKRLTNAGRQPAQPVQCCNDVAVEVVEFW